MSEQRPVDALPIAFTAPADFRVGVVAARFNGAVVTAMLEGLKAQLAVRGVGDAQIDVHEVPGAWELPVACRWLAETGRVEAVIALGAIVRGATPHFDFVASGATDGCMRVALDTGVPVVFGVLTTDNDEQALDRALPSRGNKGRDFAEAAVEMAMLRRSLTAQRGRG
ncbi:MAG: 6,7-dimethyl-8-ribityllumazine synthase [Polyangiales bacterium]